MRSFASISLLFILSSAWGQPDFFIKAHDFFGKYVNAKGGVDYEGLVQDNSVLIDLYKSIQSFDYENADQATRKAFLINTYNILVIRQVVDLYPIKSPLDNENFFDGFKHQVAGMELTLNMLEKENLFIQFPDSRLHFLLVCAGKGCPPLANFAFHPKNLETQILERTKYVLNLDWFIRVNNIGTELSQIFDWYRADFEMEGMDLIGYINQYRDISIRKKNIGFYEYDWSLNNQ